MSVNSAIGRALKVKALRELAREIGVAEAVGVLAAMVDRTPREIAKTAQEAHRAVIVAELDRMELEGKGRQAAGVLARRDAADLLDPAEVAALQDKYRRWRREEKRARARLPGARCARRPA